MSRNILIMTHILNLVIFIKNIFFVICINSFNSGLTKVLIRISCIFRTTAKSTTQRINYNICNSITKNVLAKFLTNFVHCNKIKLKIFFLLVCEHIFRKFYLLCAVKYITHKTYLSIITVASIREYKLLLKCKCLLFSLFITIPVKSQCNRTETTLLICTQICTKKTINMYFLIIIKIIIVNGFSAKYKTKCSL